MKSLRSLAIFSLALASLFVFSATPAFADARTDCTGVDADAGSDLAALRTSVICLTNRERVARGMSALKEQRTLTAVAQGHSDDMAQNNYFAHSDLSGGQPWDRAKKAGYTNGRVGENIAGGYNTPYEAMVGWMGSSGHCANILSAPYTEIGIGIATRPESDYVVYWTMVLGGNDSSAPKVNVTCPYSALTPGTVTGVQSPGNKPTPVKAKVTSLQRRSDGRYLVQGTITPAAKGTVVQLTVKRGKKALKYTVKTTKSGSFSKTVRAPDGSGKVRVLAKA